MRLLHPIRMYRRDYDNDNCDWGVEPTGDLFGIYELESNGSHAAGYS